MDTFGIGRSMEPAHSLPQQAWRIDNTTELRPDELLIDVKIVSINLVSQQRERFRHQRIEKPKNQ